MAEPETEVEKENREHAFWKHQKDEICPNLVPVEKSLGAIRDYIAGTDNDNHMNQKNDPMIVGGVCKDYDTVKAKSGGCIIS